jgi:hypothetical protein
MAASTSRLDRDSVAGLESPAAGSIGADLFDDADRLGRLRSPLSLPSYWSTSLPQMPQASTRINASSAPIFGISNCCISNLLSPT